MPIGFEESNITGMPIVPDNPVNRSIWTESIALQRKIVGCNPGPLAVGAQQAMPKACNRDSFSTQCPLPWVPDLVGSQFGSDRRSVLVVASSYNGFIKGYSARDAVLPLGDYVTARNDADCGLEQFCRSYVENVVAHDEAYYQPILRDLLEGAGCEPDCCCITDLCKASFIQRGGGPDNGNRGDIGSDTVVKDHWAKWVPYVTVLADGGSDVPLPYQWLWQRMQQCHFIIALGTIAEYGVLKIFQHMAAASTSWSWRDESVVPDHPTMNAGITNWEYGNACSRRTMGSWLKNEDWWVLGDSANQSRWRMLPVYHPAYAIVREGDIGYRMTAPRIRQMLMAT